jgi:hypothetical protein
VSDAAEDAPLAAEAEALAREVRRHASVLSRGADLPETAAAINALRVAARRYVAAVMTQTGWGNVFADLERGAVPVPAAPPPDDTVPADTVPDNTVPDNTVPDNTVPAGEHPVISYESQYRLRIRDYQAARRLLEERAAAAGLTVGEDLDDTDTGIIAALAELDGWDPYVYGQDVIEVLSAGWESVAE